MASFRLFSPTASGLEAGFRPSLPSAPSVFAPTPSDQVPPQAARTRLERFGRRP